MTDSALTIIVGGVVSCVTAICTVLLRKETKAIHKTVNGKNDAIVAENIQLQKLLRAATSGRRRERVIAAGSDLPNVDPGAETLPEDLDIPPLVRF